MNLVKGDASKPKYFAFKDLLRDMIVDKVKAKPPVPGF